MKDLPALRGARYIRQLVAEGEHEHQDFKYLISDARKIARSISAFANNSGGRLLIGVKDNGTIAGVRNEEDIFVVEQAATSYCRPEPEIEFKAYSIDAHVRVIVASIARAQSRPVMAREADGSWNAYFRVADENIMAHPLMVATWRRQDDSTPAAPLSLSDDGRMLVSLLEKSRDAGLTEREIALGLHCSEHRCADLITSLASIGIVGFRYDGHRFRIVLTEE